MFCEDPQDTKSPLSKKWSQLSEVKEVYVKAVAEKSKEEICGKCSQGVSYDVTV